MTLPPRSSRRSEEIRRRRMVASHESVTRATQSEVRATQRVSGRKSGSLLERALGRKETRRRAPATSSTLPPVMTRGAVRPMGRSLPKQGRKLRSVSLGSPGAEMRLPSLPQARLSWRLASFLLLAFLGGAVYFLWTSPRFQVESAEIHGLKRLTRGDVNRELALIGKPVFMLDEQSLKDDLLKAFPEFSSAQVLVDLPNTLVITVTERVPVLVWQQDSRSILVDEQGMTFQARDDAALSALPVIKAAGDPPPVPGETLESKDATVEEIKAAAFSRDVVKQFRPTVMFLPKTVDAMLNLASALPEGAEMVYDPAHGFGWQDRRGWPVYFGDLADLEVKYNAYRAILEQLKASGGKPELISVEFIHAPYYRLTEVPEPDPNG